VKSKSDQWKAHLNFGRQAFFEPCDCGFVSHIESPLFDTLAADQAGLCECLEMLAGCRLAHAELAGDEHSAHAILDEVAVDLWREVLSGLPEPIEDQQTFVVRQSAQAESEVHIDN